MTTSIVTTRQQAISALSIVEETYSRFGYQLSVQEELVTLLTKVAESEEETFAIATEFRNLLWSYFSGGGVSASVTRRVFAALGRENETDSRWI